MKIFQIADLHLDEEFNINQYENMLNQMVGIIVKEIDEDRRAVIICCYF